MAANMLKSLVLSGSVLRDGQAIGVGFGYSAESQAPSMPFSPRHGGFGLDAEPQRWRDHDDDVVVNRATLRAGRSDSHAGVLTHRTPDHVSTRDARVGGGSQLAAAAGASRLLAFTVASAGKTPCRGRAPIGSLPRQASRITGMPARIPPAPMGGPES
jgi:hypothetical protein